MKKIFKNTFFIEYIDKIHSNYKMKPSVQVFNDYEHSKCYFGF